MKPVVAICVALLYACTVFGIEVPAMPQLEFADTEVSYAQGSRCALHSMRQIW
jgi:hypothetical protein